MVVEERGAIYGGENTVSREGIVIVYVSLKL